MENVIERNGNRRRNRNRIEDTYSAPEGYGLRCTLALLQVEEEGDDSYEPEAQPDMRVRFGPGGGLYRILTTAEESHGRHFAFEAIEPPGGGPPLHIHATEDEHFVVLEGEVTFFIGGRVLVAREGQSAFVPRGAAHCFKNCSSRMARVLVLFTPGNIQGFFDYGLPVNGKMPSDAHLLGRIEELGPKYGLEVVGPSPL